MLIPVPGPQGGVVVIGESVIAYVRKKRSADDQAVKSIQINATIIKVQHGQCHEWSCASWTYCHQFATFLFVSVCLAIFAHLIHSCNYSKSQFHRPIAAHILCFRVCLVDLDLCQQLRT